MFPRHFFQDIFPCVRWAEFLQRLSCVMSKPTDKQLCCPQHLNTSCRDREAQNGCKVSPSGSVRTTKRNKILTSLAHAVARCTSSAFLWGGRLWRKAMDENGGGTVSQDRQERWMAFADGFWREGEWDLRPAALKHQHWHDQSDRQYLIHGGMGAFYYG